MRQNGISAIRHGNDNDLALPGVRGENWKADRGENRIMTDYISREKAFDAVFGQFCASSDETEAALNAAIEEIRAIPAADVRPVVLCRDCKHSDTFAPDCTEATFPLKCLSIRYGGVYPNWFCEHGEKREES